jgi:hypothetical protein
MFGIQTVKLSDRRLKMRILESFLVKVKVNKIVSAQFEKRQYFKFEFDNTCLCCLFVH